MAVSWLRRIVPTWKSEESSSTLGVCVSMISGNSWKLEVDAGWTVLTLKSKLVDVAGIPQGHQVICAGDHVVADHRVLAELGTTNPLQLLLVIQNIFAKLRDDDPVERRQAVQSLTCMDTLDDHVLLPYLDCLQDPISEVRRAAAEAAQKFPADQRIRQKLLLLLHDDEEEVRAEAVVSLGRVSSRGCGETTAAIAGCLSDPDWHTRCGAISALGELALDRDPAAKPAVVRALGDRNWHVRQAAVEVAGRIFDSEAVDMLATATKDWRPEVRRSAVTTIATVGQAGDRSAEILRNVLEQDDTLAVRGAICGLTRLSNDERTIEALEACHSTTTCEYVKTAADRALQDVRASVK